MSWKVCFAVSVIFIIVGAVGAFRIWKNPGRLIDRPLYALIFGVFTGATSLFLPLNYFGVLAEENNIDLKRFESLLLSLYNALKLFVIDGDFQSMLENVVFPEHYIYQMYSFLITLLFLLAPVLTFSFVLAFFKNISGYFRLWRGWMRSAFVFSELNPRSMALASDLHKKFPKSLIVFTDVFDENEERSFELIDQAKKIRAILFKKDITLIKFDSHSKKTKLSFFVIGENIAENLQQSIALIEHYRNRENTDIFAFSLNSESEFLFNSIDKGKVRFRKVNEIQSLIYNTLYYSGYEKLFASAAPARNGFKEINALVIGMGQHGTEMVKALSWFTQMDGYRLHLTAFDKDPVADSRFRALCPDLLNDEFNTGNFTPGEATYRINIESDCDVVTDKFYSLLDRLGQVTYILVALGSDELNLKTALELRVFFRRKGYHPVIDSVVFDSDKKAVLSTGGASFCKDYDISFIGDLRSFYCADILGTEIEKAALSRHKRWGDESGFWASEYNYRSSSASVVHTKMKRLCKIPGADKAPEKRTDEELWNIRRLEHRRWNAYMRSEGFVYGAERDRAAKVHNLLVDFDKLPLEEQEKDDF